MATINMQMKFEIEIPKQTWLMLRKPCRLKTDGQTDGRTDKVNPVYPPSNFVGRGYNNVRDYVKMVNATMTLSLPCPSAEAAPNDEKSNICSLVHNDNIGVIFHHYIYASVG